jgi:hypothetical protein
MIECETCSEWYHGECVGLTEGEAGTIKVYTCTNCAANLKGTPWYKAGNNDTIHMIAAKYQLDTKELFALNKPRLVGLTLKAKLKKGTAILLRSIQHSNVNGSDASGGGGGGGVVRTHGSTSSSSMASSTSSTGTHADALCCICVQPQAGRFMVSCKGCLDWFHGDCVGVPQGRKEVAAPAPRYLCERCSATYCHCGGGNDGRFMIECDVCAEWYHGDCVGLVEAACVGIDSYVCAPCATRVWCAFSVEIYNRGCHWFPRVLA